MHKNWETWGTIIVVLAVGVSLYVARDRNTSLQIPETTYACQTDNDCVSVKADACGCTQGGKATAVNVDHREEWLSHFDEGTMCIQVLSNDPSCFAKPKCISNRCELR